MPKITAPSLNKILRSLDLNGGNFDDVVVTNSKEDFYALIHVLHSVANQLLMFPFSRSPRAHELGRFRQTAFKNDGDDGVRALLSFVQKFIENAYAHPEVIKPIAEITESIPVIYSAHAEWSEELKLHLKSLNLGTNAPLRLKRSRKASSRGKCIDWPTYQQSGPDAETGPVNIKSYRNAVLLHHYREIMEFKELDASDRDNFQWHQKIRVEQHNIAISTGLENSIFQFGAIPVPNLTASDRRTKVDSILPEFWKPWQRAALELPPLAPETAPQWFEVIWEKILGEYLGHPEYKPLNPVFETQQDLTILGAAKDARRMQTGKVSKARKQRISELVANRQLEGEGTMRSNIKYSLKEAFMKLARTNESPSQT